MTNYLDDQGFLDVPRIIGDDVSTHFFPQLLPNVDELRERDFPWLGRNGRVYLDCGATSLQPLTVKEQFLQHYTTWGRGSNHSHNSNEAMLCGENYNQVSEKLKSFLHASNYGIAFTSGTTQSSNLLASRFPFESKDLLLITEAEHHSQILSARNFAKAAGAQVAYVPVNGDGELDVQTLLNMANGHKGGKVLLNLIHASNVTGVINPAQEIRENLEDHVLIYLDMAQSVGHMPINLDELNPDFASLSAHKMYGPQGVGTLLMRKDRFNFCNNHLSGGSSVLAVSKDHTAYASFPASFEPGTQNIEGVIEFGMTLDYLSNLGIVSLEKHDHELTKYFLRELQKIPGVIVYGPKTPENKISVVAFNVGPTQTNYGEVALALNTQGVSVRDGCFCAHPLLAKLTGLSEEKHNEVVQMIVQGSDRDNLSLPGAVRASFAWYNTIMDAYKGIEAIKEVAKNL